MGARKIIVSGRVQGVFYRANTKEKADQLQLSGWVRNTDDNTVEIFAEGPDAALEELVDWCHRGPEQAQVEDVLVQEMDEEDWTGFSIVD